MKSIETMDDNFTVKSADSIVSSVENAPKQNTYIEPPSGPTLEEYIEMIESVCHS